jgi:hypothetical protein
MLQAENPKTRREAGWYVHLYLNHVLHCLVAGLQCVELDFHYPSEGIHKRWDAGYRVTCGAATCDQAAFVLSQMKKTPTDETQVGGQVP